MRAHTHTPAVRAATCDVVLACACCAVSTQDYAWRNNLQFNPNEKKQGYSYTDVVLMPMANAVNRAIK